MLCSVLHKGGFYKHLIDSFIIFFLNDVKNFQDFIELEQHSNYNFSDDLLIGPWHVDYNYHIIHTLLYQNIHTLLLITFKKLNLIEGSSISKLKIQFTLFHLSWDFDLVLTGKAILQSKLEKSCYKYVKT